MSCIFPSLSESQIAIGAWNKSSYLSLFSPFHTNSRLLLPRRPLNISPRPPVQSLGFFLTCQAWPIRFPTSCHRHAEAPRAKEKPPCHAGAVMGPCHQLYTHVTRTLMSHLCQGVAESWGVTPRSELWLLTLMGRLHLSNAFPHLYTMLQDMVLKNLHFFFPF